MIVEIFALLVIYNISHWFGDYTPFSTPWMLNAKRTGFPLFPIFCHALVHAVFMAGFTETFLYMNQTGYDPFLWHWTVTDTIFCVQLSTHFIIDVLKGKMNVWVPSVADPKNKEHWAIFGFDQLLHQVVIIIQVYIFIKYFI